MLDKFREWSFKMRGGLWTLLFVIILFTASRPTPVQVAGGLTIIFLGQLWRCWAAGFIGLYRGENVKAQRLTTTGPYSLMRNPLYFGNFLIGLGWSIIAGVNAVIIFLISFYILYVLVIIPHEEKFLLAKFGREYEDYCNRTGRFFPRIFNKKDLKGNFDSKILMRSEIHTIISTLIGTLIVLIVCYIK